jgi:hypothetical protein
MSTKFLTGTDVSDFAKIANGRLDVLRQMTERLRQAVVETAPARRSDKDTQTLPE